ncbi:MAG: LysR family transcriptional regulator [Rariglobus sp.]|jgi:DNA-binding transcriptional LysR family regulator|nr:LysR family transcriptional regulator [Rariglobus sp.]
MNVHHLELFFYVARHGGISKAVRHIPYGIQQPAVSGQILALEQDIGKRLFERTPFRLTREGEELYAFIEPFFSHLGTMAARLQKQAEPQLRIGASEVVLRDYLPAILGRFRATHPRLRVTLRSGFQAQMEAALQERELDLAVVPLENRPPARIQCQRLVQLPLVLLVPKTCRIKSAAELWARGQVEETLISLPPSESVCRNFRKGLKRLKVDWPTVMEASSLELVSQYVANGYGLGVTVGAGSVMKNPKVRVLSLEGFEPVVIAVLWNSKPEPLVAEAVGEMKAYARQLWPEQALEG